MAGTCAEYDAEVLVLREDSPTRAATMYAATKTALYLVGQQMASSGGIRFAWARIFCPYGPFDDERRAIPSLIRALLRGEPFPATAGEQVRDYVHVEDVVASGLWALAYQRATGVFNVASGVPVTMRQIMETVAAVLGRTDQIHFGAPCHTVSGSPRVSAGTISGCAPLVGSRGIRWKMGYARPLNGGNNDGSE